MELETKTNIDYMGLVLDYHKSMSANKLNLVYEGEVNQAITKAFTSLAEHSLQEDKEDRRTIRKVYHVMVECLQNIYKHSDELNANGKGKKKHGIFLVAQDESGYVVSTGNMIENEKIDGIKTAIDHINSLNPIEIKELYKKQITMGVLSERGGAGLGFIDIYKKTGNPLEYRFENIDENKSFFILKTYIAK